MSSTVVMAIVGLVCCLVLAVGGFVAYRMMSGGGGDSGGSSGGGGSSSSGAGTPTPPAPPADGGADGTPVPHAFRLRGSGQQLYLTGYGDAGQRARLRAAIAQGNLELRSGLCDGFKDGVPRYAIYNRDLRRFLNVLANGEMRWGNFASPEGCFVRESPRCENIFGGKGFESIRPENGGQSKVLKMNANVQWADAAFVPASGDNYDANDPVKMSKVCFASAP